MSVSVSSCEGSFSKLKLIKTYVRSNMGEDRLSALALLSIESERILDIFWEDVISTFATVKARKVKF